MIQGSEKRVQFFRQPDCDIFDGQSIKKLDRKSVPTRESDGRFVVSHHSRASVKNNNDKSQPGCFGEHDLAHITTVSTAFRVLLSSFSFD